MVSAHLVIGHGWCGEHVDELGEVLVVFVHLGGQNHVYDAGPRPFVRGFVQVCR